MKYTVDEADIIVINTIKTRALKRFRYESRETLIREAKEALMTSYLILVNSSYKFSSAVGIYCPSTQS